ncbi:heterogeneous nuclear ribonucleoprotein Q-like isoform X3 [Dinothrombium tinctorium]|uniref:Heterogeneous nuclear ribonucleoprotein Q-like isoform X3 n=1 Tax=Dinothrombium tinctorium TaxID=1965070 RepID=A0A443RJU9_9ACAR|nr:heterogeneous nuclear ribonucleoprotein Q-like isoform X3 [Dinothrombium tinctorium]
MSTKTAENLNNKLSSPKAVNKSALTGGGDIDANDSILNLAANSSFRNDSTDERMMSCDDSSVDVQLKLKPDQNHKDAEIDNSLDNSQLQSLIAGGIHERVAERLCQLFASQKLTPKDLDDRAFEALKEFGNVEGALAVLNEFDDSSLEHVSNKSAFLCGIMKAHRQKEKAGKASQSGNMSICGANHASSSSSSSPTKQDQNHSSTHNQTHPGPDEAKLKAILDRTGYTLDVTSGQRKYGGPPPDWEGAPPCPGSEIFVGKIPKEIFEDELILLFEETGKIWDLRLMVDPLTGFNRGYCFITYCNKEGAQKAQEKFDSYEIRKGKPLKVNISVPNLRLFVGNIPKSKTKEEIYQEFSKLTSGLLEVIVYSSPDDRKRNRGFCFLEYESHKAASLAKRKLSSGRTKVWGCDILVDWADPQEEPDQETMSKVKVLYVRNLVADVTEEQLREMFEKYGTVERVKKIKDYAFVHFDDRDNALKAMNELNGKEINGVHIEISLAKPPSDRKKKEEVLRNRERRVMMMMQQRALMMGIPGVPRGPAVLPPVPPPLPPPPAAPPLMPSARSGRNKSSSVAGNMISPPSYGHRSMARGYEYEFGYCHGQYGFDEYPEYPPPPHLSHQYDYGYSHAMYASPPHCPPSIPSGPVGVVSSSKASSRVPPSRSKKVVPGGMRGTHSSTQTRGGATATTRGRFQAQAQIQHQLHPSAPMSAIGGHYGNQTGPPQGCPGPRNGKSSKRRVNSQKGVIPKRKPNPRGNSGGEHDHKQGSVSGAEWYKDEFDSFGQQWKKWFVSWS